MRTQTPARSPESRPLSATRHPTSHVHDDRENAPLVEAGRVDQIIIFSETRKKIVLRGGTEQFESAGKFTPKNISLRWLSARAACGPRAKIARRSNRNSRKRDDRTAVTIPHRRVSDVSGELLLQSSDAVLVPLIKRPLLDPLGCHKPGSDEHLHVHAQGGLANAELVRDGHGANPVMNQVAVNLPREKRLRVLEPLEDQETLVVGKSLKLVNHHIDI